MANVVTTLAAIPVIVKAGQPKGLIYPKVITLDTIGADVTIHTTSDGKYCGLCGLTYEESSAHSFSIKSGSRTLVTLEGSTALYPAINGIHWPPYISTEVGEDLIFSFATAVASTILAYVMEYDRLFFGD